MAQTLINVGTKDHATQLAADARKSCDELNGVTDASSTHGVAAALTDCASLLDRIADRLNKHIQEPTA